MIFQKSRSRLHKINIFDGGRVNLGAQNRPREAPGGNKRCHRGIGANVDVVGAVLGCFWGLLEPSWGPLGVPLGALGGFLGARWAF